MKRRNPLDPYFEEFFSAYVRTALWSSTDESTPSGGYPLDKKYGPADITRQTMMKMRQDAARFWRENVSKIMSADMRNPVSKAGHDFWLTRNGHGAGFWDGDWQPQSLGDELTRASKKFGEYNLYVSRGRIHGYPG